MMNVEDVYGRSLSTVHRNSRWRKLWQRGWSFRRLRCYGVTRMADPWGTVPRKHSHLVEFSENPSRLVRSVEVRFAEFAYPRFTSLPHKRIRRQERIGSA